MNDCIFIYDLSPVRCTFLGYLEKDRILKDRIDGRNVADINNRKICIDRSVREFHRHFFKSAIESVIERWYLCLQEDGDVFDAY